MSWYHYLSYFFAGAFLANTVPHFVRGITGHRFPSPFAKPPGKGESSPMVNVLWALANLVVGFLLLQPGAFSAGLNWATVVLFAGVAFTSVMLSRAFGDVYDKPPTSAGA